MQICCYSRASFTGRGVTRTAGSQPGLGKEVARAPLSACGDSRSSAATSSYSSLPSPASRAVLLGHNHTSNSKSHPSAGEAEPTHTPAAHWGRLGGACVSALGTVAAQDASTWLLWQHQRHGRDGESSATITASLCLSQEEAACIVPNILGKSCYGNLTSPGKHTSPPQAPPFCAPHCQPGRH